MRGDRGFGLEILDLELQDVFEACRCIGIPDTTRSRLWCRSAYPKQWSALDAMSQNALGKDWIEAVLTEDVIRMIPREALACLIREIQSGSL